MSTVGRRSPLRKPTNWLLAIGLSLVVAITLLGFSGKGDLRQSADAALDLTLPLRPPDPGKSLGQAFTPDPDAPAVEGTLANPTFTNRALDPLTPSEPDLRLVDASPFGPLPRIGDDGRRPLEVYARPFDRRDDRPRVAVLVTGLGPQVDATNASFHLPGAFSLMFSPYTDDLPAFFERARLAGHEILLGLPMEPADYPASDPGPHTLRASGTVDANIERLHWLLSRAPGYVAVAGESGAFGASAEAAPVMKALSEKGIGMIEIDGGDLEEAGKAAGLAYLLAPDWIDADPSAEAIDQALGRLEARAREEGSVIGVAEAYPVTLKRLVDWAADLDARGIALVPVSTLLIDDAGSAPQDDQASNLAQSRN